MYINIQNKHSKKISVLLLVIILRNSFLAATDNKSDKLLTHCCNPIANSLKHNGFILAGNSVARKPLQVGSA